MTTTQPWEREIDEIEKEYPMAILNWRIEDWKIHITKIVTSTRLSAYAEGLNAGRKQTRGEAFDDGHCAGRKAGYAEGKKDALKN